MAANDSNSGFVAKLTQLFAVYVIYVFVSGWTFLDYYFREFGVDPRWLDFPVQETLVKGFTVLFTHGQWLWPMYALMLTLPMLVDGIPQLRRHVSARIVVSSFLFATLVGVYFASRSAATVEARIDKSPQTRLPVIVFARKPPCPSPMVGSPPTCEYVGTVLAVRNGLLYLHHVTTREQQSGPSLAVSVFRAEDLTDIQMIEH
jgi:hypothetical protein